MADDPVKTALDPIRARCDTASSRYVDWADLKESAGDVPILLALADAVLALHQPRQLYGPVETMYGTPLCDHSPDYDGDAHYEGDDGFWYCKDKPSLRVCESCADGSAGDLWAEWPCPTYAAAAKALGIKTAEGKPDGG